MASDPFTPRLIGVVNCLRGTKNRSEDLLQVGVGQAMAHHGEILQGVFEGSDGRLHRGLVTLPLPTQRTTATFWPNKQGTISTRPAHREKAAHAVELTLRHLGYVNAGGDLTLESDIPIGHGFGSSTADVVAAIRATAKAADATLPRSTISKLAVVAEGASDAIVYDQDVVLFAHREGHILEHFGGELPPLLVVGFRAGASVPVNTLDLPRARYTMQEIEQFRVLRGLVAYAVKHQDPRLIGQVATASACISQRHLPKPDLQLIIDLAETHGACGVQVAHSGTLMGALFDASQLHLSRQLDFFANDLERSGFADLKYIPLQIEGG